MRAAPELLAVVGWGLSSAILFHLIRLRRAARRASHEIRGPLSALRLGFYSTARTGVGGCVSEGVVSLAPHLRRVELAIEDLERTLFRGAGRNGDIVENHELRELVLGVAESWRPAIEGRGRSLEFDWRAGDIIVRGCGSRLEQAVANLLANALEHGRGSVKVCGVRVGGRVHVEVHDRGHVRALRQDSIGRNGRKGHGLAIVSEAARKHGGHIRTEMSSEGTCVKLDLPAAETGECIAV